MLQVDSELVVPALRQSMNLVIAAPVVAVGTAEPRLELRPVTLEERTSIEFLLNEDRCTVS